MSNIEDDYERLTEVQQDALPLVTAVLSAVCVKYDAADVQAVVAFLSQHPRLLVRTIAVAAEAIEGKRDELERRLKHPQPTIVDSPKPEKT